MPHNPAETHSQFGEHSDANRAPVDRSGQVLGDFRLLRQLGEGGMGQVYLAEQLSLKRRVALKLLRSELASNETNRKRFEAEAKAVAQLTHPNIVQVYAVGAAAGVHYMALEYVDGRNLREYLARKGSPDRAAALGIMRQVALALQRAAELGIIHRDVKPENILLTRKGEVKVADFGLSRMRSEGQPPLNLTQTGVTMGTPLYMSPEQVEGKPLDPRTDLYSFGVTCYHMLAGQPPFQGENAFAVALQHVNAEPVPLATLRPDLPSELCAIVARLMAKDPDQRYQTPREVLKDLQRLREMLHGGPTQPLTATTPIPAPPVAPPALTPTSTRHSPSRRGLIGTIAASLLLAVATGSLLGWHLRAIDDPWADEDLASETPDAADAPIAQVLLGSLDEQEDALFKLVKATENPGKDLEKQRHGVQYRVDLAVFLLKQRVQDPDALNRADRFFQEQSRSAVEPYAAIGQLGAAMVLAFRDQVQESNAAFLRLQKYLLQRPSPLLSRQPEFFRLIGKALEHNQLNGAAQEIPFPPELNKVRQALSLPAPPPLPPGLQGKPAGPRRQPGGGPP
jgi:serine/threonine-protein kinase